MAWNTGESCRLSPVSMQGLLSGCWPWSETLRCFDIRSCSSQPPAFANPLSRQLAGCCAAGAVHAHIFLKSCVPNSQAAAAQQPPRKAAVCQTVIGLVQGD